MARRIVATASKTYTVAMDDLRPAGRRLWGIVRGWLIDELTQRPIVGRVTIKTDKEGMVQQAVASGIAGLVGIPERVFSKVDPATGIYDLAINAQQFTIVFGAEGYLSRRWRVSVGPIPGFPDISVPISLGAVEMHRQPIIIRGRVMRNGSPLAPAGGLTVAITAVWRRLPSATATPPADPCTIMAICPAIRYPRTVATARVRRREVVNVSGEDKTLLEYVTAGTQQFHCSNRVGLSTGDILTVDPGDPSVAEYVPIAAIDGAAGESQPARVSLSYPLAFSHRRDAVVRRVNPQGPGTDNTLAVDALTGDSCLLLDSVADLVSASTVEISDGAQPDEYLRILPYSATTDAEGFFQLPPLHRVAQLNLSIHGGSLSADIDGFIPDYNRREDWFDVVV